MTPAHGTPAMYRRHLARGEKCKRCEAANAEQSRKWRKPVGMKPITRDSGSRSLEAQFEPALTAGEWARANGYDAKQRRYVG